MLREGSISSLLIWAKTSTIMQRLEIWHLMAWTTSSTSPRCRLVLPVNQELAMPVKTIGLDLAAKSIFQIHGVDARGNAVLKRCIRRGELLAFFGSLTACLVGMEACSSVHHWARELMAIGHDGSPDPSPLRAALCEAAQDRCRRRGGELRGGRTA